MRVSGLTKLRKAAQPGVLLEHEGCARGQVRRGPDNRVHRLGLRPYGCATFGADGATGGRAHQDSSSGRA